LAAIRDIVKRALPKCSGSSAHWRSTFNLYIFVKIIGKLAQNYYFLTLGRYVPEGRARRSAWLCKISPQTAHGVGVNAAPKILI